jgi:dolichol-phosphate mannosyltransferase
MRKLSFPHLPDGGFDIVLLTSDVKNVLLTLKEANPFWQGQILWTGFPILIIPYERKKRLIGKSRWTFSKKIKYMLDGVLNYSYAPIRFISFVGILAFLAGILYSAMICINYFFYQTPFNGWAPIMILILFFSGFQLLMLGIIGEYLWRTLDQVKGRPQYIIKERY